MKVNVVTLGCAKNLVDSEKMLRQLKENGHEVFHDAADPSDAVIINTCGFILDAKKESIDTILSFVRARKRGEIRKLIVMGCLSERYADSLKQEIPEVDAFFGVNDHRSLLEALDGRYYAGILQQRVLTTPTHYAYLKISEGCNRNCAFCAIPSIRGKQRSVPVDDLLKEARDLAAGGVKEILLIAQDLTSYGTDIYGKKMLPALLGKLTEIPGIEWIRLHYAYPSGFPVDEIISMMQTNPKICRYLDVPIQHVNNRVLKSMNRGHGRKEIEDLIGKFRQEIPEITVRTSVITGFPGESREEYRELREFVRMIKFDRLGVFPYSHEETTQAGEEMQDDVPARTKKQRMDELMSLQQEISLEKNQAKTGSELKVIIDRREGNWYVGRTEGDSPEVDNEVLIPARDKELKMGDFCTIRITGAGEFELYGEMK